MSGLLLSRLFVERFGEQLDALEAEAGLNLKHIVLDTDGDTPLAPADLEEVNAAFLSNDLRYRRDLFIQTINDAPNLKWLHAFSVGFDKDRYPLLRDRGVVITNSPGANAAPIALTALGAILRLGRPFAHWEAAQARHAWDPIHYDNAPRELAGQVIVIVGTGELGRRIAQHARHVGFHVIGVRRGPPLPDEPLDEVYHPAALAEVLPRADWLVLACPLTSETHHLIDARAFALLPRGVNVLNVARGAILDQAAFIEAVRSGQVGGAYLDVADPEPLPEDSELWDLPNVLISPHNAAVSTSYPRESAERFLANLVRWCAGEPLVGVV